jgi:putative spermidine/putrescine transport system permease protein
LLRKFADEANIMAARDGVFGWLYISPLMLVLVPFFVAPLLVIITASFLQGDGFGGIIVSPTLQNYIRPD